MDIIHEAIMDCADCIERDGTYGATRENIDIKSIGYKQVYILSECLVEAINNTKEGYVLEIGSRTGTSALMFITVMAKMKQLRALHTVDPWIVPCEREYDNIFHMFLERMIKRLNALKQEKIKWKTAGYSLNDFWMHFSTTDEIYIDHIHKTLPKQYDKLCFAFLDGPHTFTPVIKEFKFVREHLLPGGVVVIDDYDMQSDVAQWIVKNCPEFRLSGKPNFVVCRKQK